MATALTMVNRVLRRMREPAITSFSTASNKLDQAVLDAVNEAARFTLYSNEWEFMKRWAELTLKPAISNTSDGTITNGSTVFALASVTDVTDLTGSFSARIAFTGDSVYGGDSYRIASGLVSGGFLGALDTEWPGTSDAGTANYTAFVCEYLLPDTVKGIYQVLHEGTPITVEQRDEISLNQRYPRKWDTTGSPEIVAVGGSEVATFNSGTSSAAAPLLRMLVYPVPDKAYSLRYQYLLRYTELSATTDTIPGCPDEVVDRIVDLAYAKIQGSGIGNDAAMAAFARQVFENDTRKIHNQSKSSKGRRFVLRSLDQMGSESAEFGRLPTDTYGEP